MMNKENFKKLKAFIKTLRATWPVKNLVAEVYNLYQECLISEKQEGILYEIVDPDDEEDCPADLWFEEYGCSPLWEFAQTL